MIASVAQPLPTLPLHQLPAAQHLTMAPDPTQPGALPGTDATTVPSASFGKTAQQGQIDSAAASATKPTDAPATIPAAGSGSATSATAAPKPQSTALNTPVVTPNGRDFKPAKMPEPVTASAAQTAATTGNPNAPQVTETTVSTTTTPAATLGATSNGAPTPGAETAAPKPQAADGAHLLRSLSRMHCAAACR